MSFCAAIGIPIISKYRFAAALGWSRQVLCHDFADQGQAMIQHLSPTKSDRRSGTGSQQWGGQINDLIENGSKTPIALSAVSGSRMRPC
jgi:hypothetical protein